MIVFPVKIRCQSDDKEGVGGKAPLSGVIKGIIQDAHAILRGYRVMRLSINFVQESTGV